MDLESCPEQISDKVFQDEHSALPGKLKGWWIVNGGEGGGGLTGEGELERNFRSRLVSHLLTTGWRLSLPLCKWERQKPMAGPWGLGCEL